MSPFLLNNTVSINGLFSVKKPNFFVGPITPAVFALDERTSIDSGGTNQFWVDQGFAIDYLIKIQVKQIIFLMNACKSIGSNL